LRGQFLCSTEPFLRPDRNVVERWGADVRQGWPQATAEGGA
jgi:hypothetical protein